MSTVKKRAIYVTDEPAMTDLARLVLSRRGLELSAVVGGTAALEAIRRARPDLILIDLIRTDGWPVYEQLKADPELKDIPIFIIGSKNQSIDDLLDDHTPQA